MNDHKTYDYKTEDETLTVYPKLNMYVDNDNLYVGLDYYDEEFDIIDSYCDLTVNIHRLPYLESAVDMTYGMEDKIRFLNETGIAEPTGKAFRSGFGLYPIYRFKEDKLREIDPDMFAKYSKAHGIEPEKKPALDTQIKQAKGREQQSSEKGDKDHER